MDLSELSRMMHTKSPATVVVLGVVSSVGHIMPPNIFLQGFTVNADKYIDVIKAVFKPWIDKVRNGRPYVFQQGSAASHKAIVTTGLVIREILISCDLNM